MESLSDQTVYLSEEECYAEHRAALDATVFQATSPEWVIEIEQLDPSPRN